RAAVEAAWTSQLAENANLKSRSIERRQDTPNLGAGSSVIFPLAMSAAAQLEDRPAAVNIAALAQISFCVFLAAPPLLGLVAEQAGIRVAFSLCLPLILLGFMNLRGLSGSPKK
ncbi:MAG: hypothetical protein ACPHTB_08865, partial [Candidatus Puniceispirillaceae bacterium]